jgi:hypothetical protein
MEPFDIEPFDIAPAAAGFFMCFFAGADVIWPFDIAPDDIEPELMAPLDIAPGWLLDIAPLWPLDIEPDWPFDIDPDDMEPLFWSCAWAAVAAAAARTRANPAFLAKRSIGVLPQGRRTVAATGYSRDTRSRLHR